MAFQLPTIKNKTDFFLAKIDTLIKLLKDLVEKDVGLDNFDGALGEWIEAWTALDEASLEALEKDEDDDLAYRVDEFVGQLMGLRFALKESMLRRCQCKIEKLERKLKCCCRKDKFKWV